MARTTIELRIRRQDGPSATPRWEEFSLPHRPGLSVISCLAEIRRRPVTKQGRNTTPVAWECSCLEEVCGACTMLVDGRPRQSCAALVDRLPAGVITLEPIAKFPVLRDLVVDRRDMFDALRRVRAWHPLAGEGAPDAGRAAGVAERVEPFTRCMTCGACMEACPQFNERSDFIGPAPLGQVRLFDALTAAPHDAAGRLETIMGDGGLEECGNAQNCVEVCPQEIPLTEAFGELGRRTLALGLRGRFGRPRGEGRSR